MRKIEFRPFYLEIPKGCKITRLYSKKGPVFVQTYHTIES
jgi:hypothetical protein